LTTPPSGLSAGRQGGHERAQPCKQRSGPARACPPPQLQPLGTETCQAPLQSDAAGAFPTRCSRLGRSPQCGATS
jgi:hypothetical protein